MTAGSITRRSRQVHAWRELAALLFLPADVIWLTGWFCLLTNGQSIMPVGGIFLTFVLVNGMAYLVLRLLFAWQAPVALRLALGALGLLSCTWLGESLLVYQGIIFDFYRILEDIWVSFRGARGLSLEFWALASIIFLWVRGITYTRAPVTQDLILSRSQLGLFMSLILVLIYKELDLSILMSGLCIFLIFTLSSLGLARIADINLHRGGRRLLFSWDWFLVLSGASTGLVLIASLFTLLTGSWISLLVIALTNGILMVLRFIIERLIVPLAKAVLAVILYLLQLFYEPEKWAQIEKPKIELFNYFEEAKPVQLADPTAEGLKAAQPYMLGILLSLVAVIILVMLLRLPRGEQLGDADGVGEKTGGNALKQLRKAISRGLKNTMDRFAKRVNLRRVTGMFRAARIRWIYQQFELLAARKGYPRQAAVTPREFQSCVTQYFSGGEEDIDLLTAAYQSVRYGELPETAGEVTRVVKAWEHLKNIKVVRQAHPKQRQKR
jgi:hypothetical protein